MHFKSLMASLFISIRVQKIYRIELEFNLGLELVLKKPKK